MRGRKFKWVVGSLFLLVLVGGVYFGKNYLELEKMKEKELAQIASLTDKVTAIEAEALTELTYEELVAGQEAFESKVEALKKDVLDIELDRQSSRELDRRLTAASKDYAINLERGLMKKEQKIFAESRDALEQLKTKTQPMLVVGEYPIEVAELEAEINGLKATVGNLSGIGTAKDTFMVEADDLLKNYQTKVAQAEQLEKERQEKAEKERQEKAEKERKEKEEKERKAKTEKERSEKNRNKDKDKDNRKETSDHPSEGGERHNESSFSQEKHQQRNQHPSAPRE